MPIRTWRMAAAAAIIMTIVAACSNPTNPDCNPSTGNACDSPDNREDPQGSVPPHQVVTKYGGVSISLTDIDEPIVFLGAYFYQSNPITVNDLRKAHGVTPVPFCLVASVGENPDPLPAGFLIDAGSALSVRDSSGDILFEVERKAGFDYNELYMGALPEGSRLTIPGSHYPGFSDIRLEIPDELEFSGEFDPESSVSDNTKIEWTPVPAPKNTFSTVTLVFQVGQGEASKMAVCGGPDNGRFEFPAETIDDLGGLGFEANLVSYSRSLVVERLNATSGAYLIVGTSTGSSPLGLQ